MVRVKDKRNYVSFSVHQIAARKSNALFDYARAYACAPPLIYRSHWLSFPISANV